MSRDRYRAYPFEPGPLLSRTIGIVGEEGWEGRDFKAWTSPCAPPCSAKFVGMGSTGGKEERGKRGAS
ncbi:uncharacterized protein BO87DRAFT_93798 [Aspergillus neoniger CBS 115656]|uniref:Uncharacterized protein n=1 Tax=Aspergillus neoniger (strain CBS 115656) TaxID=1448310 RepID=A0A318YFH3_ASPNB|nr:hypothetical protein BO87DRAFT_93798 [Aspergillus neoniger CBS 115656]PYH33116.1 hypothetical protein BO87DRAFT_93798 [Aspergillus neoniger CBS 115656]